MQRRVLGRLLGSGLLWAFLGGEAGAITLIADPGPLGPQDAATQSLVFPIADPGALLGAPLDGRTLDVDVVMADMKHLKVLYGPTSDDQYTVTLELTLDQAPNGVPPLGHGGYLSDENGLSVLPDEGAGVVQNPGAVAPFIPYVGWDLTFFGGADGLIHHGVHFEDIVFPTTAGPTVTGARMRVIIFDDSPETSVLEVGEWVPEPDAAVLGLLGALALGAARRGRGGWRSRPRARHAR